jgi:hypothetical protein
MPGKTGHLGQCSGWVVTNEGRSRDTVVRAASHDVLFAPDVHIDEMDVQSLPHIEQFDEALRVEDLLLYGVETVRPTKKAPIILTNRVCLEFRDDFSGRREERVGV